MEWSKSRIWLCRRVCVALLLILSLGGPAMSSTTPAPPKPLYRCAGSLAYMALQPDGTGRHVIVAEWPDISSWPSGLDKSPLRFVCLDLETGDSRIVGELDTMPFVPLFELSVSVAPTGRIAFICPSRPPYPVQVIEPDGATRTVKEEKEDVVYGPAWHPDSTHLLLCGFNVAKAGVEAGAGVLEGVQVVVKVLAVPREGTTSEEVLPGVSAWGDTWSSDGGSIYALWLLTETTVRIEAVSWPSLTPRALATATIRSDPDVYPLARLLLAQDSGDLVWLSPLGTEPESTAFQVWRMPPGGEPRATALRLSAIPMEVAISPDGLRLALARFDGRLVVGDLASGVKVLLPELPSRLERRVYLSWAQQGTALVAASTRGGAVWRVPVPSGTTTAE